MLKYSDAELGEVGAVLPIGIYLRISLEINIIDINHKGADPDR